MWNEKRDEYVLVKSAFGYGIVNKVDKKVLLVCDAKLEGKLIQKMIENGNRIYDNIKQAYSDIWCGYFVIGRIFNRFVSTKYIEFAITQWYRENTSFSLPPNGSCIELTDSKQFVTLDIWTSLIILED